MKRHLPNAITLLNLFLGCCAIISVFQHSYVQAFWFVFAAVAADYADGLVARLLGVHSELGKELDSMADLVSFGVVPAMVYYRLLANAFLPEGAHQLCLEALPGFLVAVFSGLRLAKFNLDSRQVMGFIGLPTPSSTIFTMGVLLIYHFDTFGMHSIVASPVFLYACVLGLSYLLVAEIPMFSLKFKSFSWKGNEIKFTFVAIALILLVFTREAAFAIVILLYVLFSIIKHFVKPSSKPA